MPKRSHHTPRAHPRGCLTHRQSFPAPVYLFIFDLSKGLSRAFSKPLLGKFLRGIYHSSVVFRGREFYFGREGVSESHPGCTYFEKPSKNIYLGLTDVTYNQFRDWLAARRESDFKKGTYHLLTNNCNDFSNQCTLYLTNTLIPHEILFQSRRLLQSPNGPLLGLLINIFERQ